MRQGLSLSRIEDHAGEAGAAAARNWTLRYTDNRDPATMRTVLGQFGRCWCGDPRDHDWPGRDAGTPHPRVLPEGLRRHPEPGQDAAARRRGRGPDQ